MNRSERRRLMKDGEMTRTKTYHMSEQQVKKLTEEQMQDTIERTKQLAIKLATDCLLASFVIALKTQHSFGPKRLRAVLDEVQSQFEATGAGIITVEELLQCAADYGIELRGE